MPYFALSWNYAAPYAKRRRLTTLPPLIHRLSTGCPQGYAQVIHRVTHMYTIATCSRWLHCNWGGRGSAVGYCIVTYHDAYHPTYHDTYHVPIVVPAWLPIGTIVVPISYTLDTLSLRVHTYTMVCCHVLGDANHHRCLYVYDGVLSCASGWWIVAPTIIPTNNGSTT